MLVWLLFKTSSLGFISSIHPLRLYSTQNVGAAAAVSWAIGHNPGWVANLTQDTRRRQCEWRGRRQHKGKGSKCEGRVDSIPGLYQAIKRAQPTFDL